MVSGSLLLRRECCSFSNGEYLKAGLAELEQWCLKATNEVGYRLTNLANANIKNREIEFFIIIFLLYFTVGWIILGGTPTHKTSCRVSGKFS